MSRRKFNFHQLFHFQPHLISFNMLLLMAFEHEPEPLQAGLFWPPKALIMTSVVSASAKQATLLQLTHVDQMF